MSDVANYGISPLAVICPLCGAGPDEPCRVTHLGSKGTGKHRRTPHKHRYHVADIANIPDARAAEIKELERDIEDLRWSLRRAKPNSLVARDYPVLTEEIETRLQELRNTDD